MEFGTQARRGNNLIGISIVALLHVIMVYALVTGLARKVVDVIKKPMETRIIQEIKPPQPDTPPPPPPPKLALPPPAYIPPVEVSVQVAAPAANTISAVTTVKPTEAAPPAKPVEATPAPHVPVRVAPVVDAARSCARPEYPAASARLEETGTVTLAFLIGLDGKVVEGKVERSSGYARLDRAALDALSLCQFKPGTVDGKPEQSWAQMRYTWQLN